MNVVRLFIMVLTLATVGCTTRKATPPNAEVMASLGTIAVVPFENYSDNANAGLIVSDQLANELMVSSSLDIVDPETVRLALAPHAGEVWSAGKIAKLLKVPTVITGTVTEYRYKSGVSQQPVIGFTLYLIDAKSGKVLWSANTAKGSSAFFDRSGLGSLTQDRCAEMVEKLLSGKSAASIQKAGEIKSSKNRR